MSLRARELAAYALPAVQMYTGRQHQFVVQGINALRERYGRGVIDLVILSAGYGLIAEDEVIVPYDFTLSGLSVSELTTWSHYLGVSAELDRWVKPYDLVIFLLGREYLRALGLPLESHRKDQTLLFLCSKSTETLIPKLEHYLTVIVGKPEATIYGCGLVSLKGLLFKLLAEEMVKRGLGLLTEVKGNPSRWLEVISEYKKQPPMGHQQY